MSSKREAYRFHEDTLLAELKLRKPPMTWKEITDSFNSAMPENRQRTIHGLKYEWRKIKHNYLPSNPAVRDPEHVFAAQWTIWDGSGAQRHVFSGIGFRGTTFLPVGLKCTANTEWYHIHVSTTAMQGNRSSEAVSRGFESMETGIPPPLSPRRAKPNPNIPEEILLPDLDYLIRTHGGSTSVTDRLRTEMTRSKQRRAQYDEEILDLKRHIGRLQAELAYLQEVKGSLMQLYTSIVKINKETVRIQNMLQHSIEHCSAGLGKAENQFLGYWGINMDHGYEGFI
ncbi:uncharacterized protein TRUGW13939_07629 [Talaromyces rugulosus]|uniref:Uncharacterized protein n=1 Tax=Talaromyces rugulosus TaxID=121627 RepID=A0A7H8R276_TALRU|nr:uncharacterized protein TRUGW13939_07629 [Talaromyces rugulosus]QKX60484.1 hypothetical protein TRUGW13939_07629 [Talaromyces rugulosus]